MAYIYYDSNLIRPVPTVSINESTIKNGAGETIGNTYDITVNITLITHKGSPRSDGSFWSSSNDPPDENILFEGRLAALARKQEAIRDLFSTEGKLFEVQPLDGSQPIKFNPRVISINFSEGRWTDTSVCTIQLQADKLFLGTGDVFARYLNSSEESWQIDTDETPENLDSPRTYRLSHTVSAQGKRHYDETGALVKEPWLVAKDEVNAKLGFDINILTSGVNSLPAYYGGFNHIRNENIDKAGGSYSVTETWLIASGTALEDFTINTVNGSDGLTRVTVDGNITGLEQRDSNLNLTVSKWSNAESKFSVIEPLIKNRAETYSSASLNAIPLSTTIGRNPVGGTISYSYEYDSRLANFVSDTISEVVSIQSNLETDLFATIGVIGRSLGNLLQDLNTKQHLERTVNIELVFDSDYIPSGLTASQILNDYNPRLHAPQSTEISSIITAADPVAAGVLNNNGSAATKKFTSAHTEDWNPHGRSYRLTKTWAFE